MLASTRRYDFILELESGMGKTPASPSNCPSFGFLFVADEFNACNIGWILR